MKDKEIYGRGGSGGKAVQRRTSRSGRFKANRKQRKAEARKARRR